MISRGRVVVLCASRPLILIPDCGTHDVSMYIGLEPRMLKNDNSSQAQWAKCVTRVWKETIDVVISTL